MFGSVQVPTSGDPIVMMAEHQTVGGYAKIKAKSSPWTCRSSGQSEQVTRFALAEDGASRRRNARIERAQASGASFFQKVTVDGRAPQRHHRKKGGLSDVSG